MTTARRLFVYDSRKKWVKPLVETAARRGWNAWEFESPLRATAPGYALVHVHADPDVLPADRQVARQVADRGITMVTDLAQVEVYEEKREQFRRWGLWMPKTWVVEDLDQAKEIFDAGDWHRQLPLISKADVGASSYNVRLIETPTQLFEHLRAAFTPPGIPVKCCAGERRQHYQLGYVLLQEFVPHSTTYRVNAVGRQRAVFHRHCYPDRPMAQTGNVTPVSVVDDETASLLAWADDVFEDLGTRWCAIDALRVDDGHGWQLLETSLRWPHPGARDCDRAARFFHRDGADDYRPGRTFGAMWDVLIDELEAGAFDE